MPAQTRGGRPLRRLTVLDAYSRLRQSTKKVRHSRSDDVRHRLTGPRIAQGVPGSRRTDNGPEFAARAGRTWLSRAGAGPLVIEPGRPRESGHAESFNGELCDELLDGETFATRRKAQVLIAAWRRTCIQIRLHSSRGHRPRTREASMAASAWLATPQPTA